MATKRKLINKKAFDEMMLLKELLDFYNKDEFVVSIRIDDNNNEVFMECLWNCCISSIS